MKTFEYLIVDPHEVGNMNTVKSLNEMGAEGWTLDCINWGMFYFQREIIPSPASQKNAAGRGMPSCGTSALTGRRIGG
jgi:hypothetical protein